MKYSQEFLEDVLIFIERELLSFLSEKCKDKNISNFILNSLKNEIKANL